MRIRGPVSVLLASALSLLVAAPAFAADVLIFGPSEATEEEVATGDGHTVTVADEATWAGMTTEQFAAFDAIVIGDAGCNGAAGILDAAITNRATWSAAVNGPIIVHTFDPGAHEDGAGGNQDTEVTSNGIGHAASGTATGLYFAIGCYYNDNSLVELTILDEFGQFIVDGLSGDLITIVDGTHPAMAGLTDEGLSNWGSSTHSRFTTFPETFDVLATEGGEVGPLGGGSNPVPLPIMLVLGAAPTPTPTPTPTTPGTAAPTPTPATSQLPDTTATAPGSPAPTVVAMLAVLVLASVGGVIELRRRGVGDRS